MLGYNKASAKFEGDEAIKQYIGEVTVGGFIWSGVVGARYEFNKKMGMYVEAGYGIANITAGLAFKF